MIQAAPQQYAVERSHGRTALAIYGDLDIASAEQVRNLLLAELTRPGTEILALDLSGVTFMDSTGLSVLVIALHVAERGRRRFHVTATSARVHRVLHLTGLLERVTAARGRPEPRQG